MNIKAGLIDDMVTVSSEDFIAYDTPDGVIYQIRCMIDGVSFASNGCRYLRLEISEPPTLSASKTSGLLGLASRLNTMRSGVSENIGTTILTKHVPVDQFLKLEEYRSLASGKPVSYRFFTDEQQNQSSAIETKTILSKIAKESLVSGVDPSLLFGGVPISSRPRIISVAKFLKNMTGSFESDTAQLKPIIISSTPSSKFSTFTQSYATSNFIMVNFEVKQDEILGDSKSKTIRVEVSALDSESSPISFSQKIQLTIPGNDSNLKDPNVMNSSVDMLGRKIVSFDTPDLVSYGIFSTFANEPYIMREVGYIASDSTVMISSPPPVSSRIVMNPEKIVVAQNASTCFPFYIVNGEQQDTWKIVFEKLPTNVETVKISMRRPDQPGCLKFLHQVFRTQGERSFNISTSGLASGQDYIVNIEFEDSRVGKIEASNEILWTYKKKTGWASLSSVTTSRVTVFDDTTRSYVTQVNIKGSAVDNNTAWSDFNNSLSQSGVTLATDAATNRFAKVVRIQSIDLLTGEQQFISEGLPLNSFAGDGLNLKLQNVNPHILVIDVGIIDNEGVYFAGSTSQDSLSTASSYSFFRRTSSPSGDFGLSFSKYYTGVSVAATDTSSFSYGVTNLNVDQTRSPDYDIIQWELDSSNSSSPIDHFQIVATIDGTSYLIGCVPFRPSSLKYRYVERNLSGLIGRITYTVNPILTNMQSSSPSSFTKIVENGLVNLNPSMILSQGTVDDDYDLNIKSNVAFERVINAIQ